MDNESAMPPPLGVRLLRRQGRGSGHERCRPKSNRPQAGVNGPVPRSFMNCSRKKLRAECRDGDSCGSFSIDAPGV